MTNFAPEQMQEPYRRCSMCEGNAGPNRPRSYCVRCELRMLSEGAKGHGIEPWVAEVLSHGADTIEKLWGQAAEIERLNRSHQGRVVIAHDGCRAQIETWIARAEAAESRLLALREQVEGIRGYFIDPTKNTDLVWRADVLALLDPRHD